MQIKSNNINSKKNNTKEKYTYGHFWLTLDVFNIGCSNNSKYVEFVKNPIKEAYKFMEWDYDTEKRA